MRQSLERRAQWGDARLHEVSSEQSGEVEVCGGVAAQVQLDVGQEAHAVLHGGVDGNAAAFVGAVDKRGVNLQP